MNSLELTRELYKKGYLSKEAAVAALRERDKLIKEALFVEAAGFFKQAGFFDRLLGRGVGAGVAKSTVPLQDRGFWGKLTGAGGKLPAKGGETAAGWSDVGSNLTKILALAGLTSASAAGIGAISQHHRDKALQKEIEISYKLMKREHPRIAEMDQKKVRNHFEILSRYAPSLAANPTVAGAFVTTQVTRGIIDPAMVRTLAEAQEKIDKVRGLHGTHGLPFDKATSLATAAMAGG